MPQPPHLPGHLLRTPVLIPALHRHEVLFLLPLPAYAPPRCRCLAPSPSTPADAPCLPHPSSHVPALLLYLLYIHAFHMRARVQARPWPSDERRGSLPADRSQDRRLAFRESTSRGARQSSLSRRLLHPPWPGLRGACSLHRPDPTARAETRALSNRPRVFVARFAPATARRAGPSSAGGCCAKQRRGPTQRRERRRPRAAAATGGS